MDLDLQQRAWALDRIIQVRPSCITMDVDIELLGGGAKGFDVFATLCMLPALVNMVVVRRLQ